MGKAASKVTSNKNFQQANKLGDPLDIFGFEAKAKEEERKKKLPGQLADAQRQQNDFIRDYEKNVQLTSAADIGPANQFAGGAQGAANYQSSLGAATGDIGYLRGIAQSEGPTKAAERQTALQRLEEQSNIENLGRLQNTQGAQAFSNLASQGGAESGARERLASGLGSQGLRESQAARREGALQRLGIAAQDETSKLNLAGQLPGQQLNLAAEQRGGLTADQTAAYNVAAANQQKALQENKAKYDAQQNLYKLKAGFAGANIASNA